MAKLKSGNKKLIVTGCLAQRYSSELIDEIPEVDYFLGTSDYYLINKVLDDKPTVNGSGLVHLGKKTKNLVSSELNYIEKFDLPRVNTSPSFSAYLRISEGCDNLCAFCIIPKLRGKQRSRTIDDLVNEAHNLAQRGVFELNLIGQDLTAYGFDLKGRPKLADLLVSLAKVPGIKWIRQLYAYPRSFSDAYFQAFSLPNVLPYIDMPVQHGSEHVLRLMGRGGSKERLMHIIKSLKDNIANLVLRTTVMVGFPGEREDDFKELCDFILQMQFDHLGVFKYSNEENTKAFTFNNQIKKSIKEERYHQLMALQQKISREKIEKLIGTVQDAVVEGISEEHDYVIKGRIWSQAPDIDGVVYISCDKQLKVGQIVKLNITESHDYDLSGEVLI
jgi:ribosomal protein S12 methylthiotransferase